MEQLICTTLSLFYYILEVGCGVHTSKFLLYSTVNRGTLSPVIDKPTKITSLLIKISMKDT